MEPEKIEKYEGIHLHYKFWLSTGDNEYILSDRRIKLLTDIYELGSLAAAAKKRKIAYRKAWGDLKEAEELLGFPLLKKHRGGKEGGTTVLTTDAMILIESYKDFISDIQKNANEIIIKFKSKLKGIEYYKPEVGKSKTST